MYTTPTDKDTLEKAIKETKQEGVLCLAVIRELCPVEIEIKIPWEKVRERLA